jgi:hypothetical protein
MPMRHALPIQSQQHLERLYQQASYRQHIKFPVRPTNLLLYPVLCHPLGKIGTGRMGQ